MSGTSRRGFLLGLAGAATLIAAPKLIVSPLPVLWGDGLHDDTEAFQALLDGKPIRSGRGDTFAPLFETGDIVLRGGTYLVSQPLALGRAPNVLLRELTIRGVGMSQRGPLLNCAGPGSATLHSLALVWEMANRPPG